VGSPWRAMTSAARREIPAMRPVTARGIRRAAASVQDDRE
jgi:hypothetical protein